MNPVPAGREQTLPTDFDDVLATVWPDELRTLFLRTCVGDGAEASDAWRRFVSITGNPKGFIERDMSGFKGLLPLVHSAARRNAFELDPKLWTYLRSATLREELRYGAYRDLCGRVLSACVDAEIPVIALKACALAETVYEAPAERHCHAIDLLVSAGALTHIERVLRPLGFCPARISEARPGGRRGFRHESGLPLVVHCNLFDPPIYPIEVNSLWSASTEATIAGAPVRVLAPAHSLLYILVAAFHDPGRDNARWACDTWRLLDSRTGLDWNELVRQAQLGGLEIPVLTMLRFMAGPLGATVPKSVLATLATSAHKSSRPTREAALSAAIRGLSALREIWSHRLRSPKTRRMLLRFLFLPSMQYIQWRFGTKSRAGLPFLYLYRPLAYVALRIWWRALRLPVLKRLTHYERVAGELKKRRA
jgi:hypothetical protein